MQVRWCRRSLRRPPSEHVFSVANKSVRGIPRSLRSGARERPATAGSKRRQMGTDSNAVFNSSKALQRAKARQSSLGTLHNETYAPLEPDTSRSMVLARSRSESDTGELWRSYMATLKGGITSTPDSKCRQNSAKNRLFNPWLRPRASMSSPLRTTYLDPSVCMIPRQSSLLALKAGRKRVNVCHSSYDIDGDGFVSSEDLRLAKGFDVRGNGYLDDVEQKQGRVTMAKQFYAQNNVRIRLKLCLK